MNAKDKQFWWKLFCIQAGMLVLLKDMNLNKQDGHRMVCNKFDQVLDKTTNKLLVKS